MITVLDDESKQNCESKRRQKQGVQKLKALRPNKAGQSYFGKR
jgi:hypothetical protein